jgi:hypothetical protein
MEDGNVLNYEIHEPHEMVFFRAILQGYEVCSFGSPGIPRQQLQDERKPGHHKDLLAANQPAAFSGGQVDGQTRRQTKGKQCFSISQLCPMAARSCHWQVKGL